MNGSKAREQKQTSSMMQLKIKHKLMLSFLAIALLAVLASVTSIVFLRALSGSFKNVVEVDMPSMAHMAVLSERGNKLALIADDLEKASSEAERKEAYKKLSQKTSEFDKLVQDGITGQLEKKDRKTLLEIAMVYKGLVNNIGDVSKNYMTVQTQKDQRLLNLFKIHKEISEMLLPIIEKAHNRVSLGVFNATQESRTIIDKLINKDVAELRNLIELKMEVGLLIGTLKTALDTTDKQAISDSKELSLMGLDRIKQLSKELKIENSLKKIVEVTTNKNNIFSKIADENYQFSLEEKTKLVDSLLNIRKETDEFITDSLYKRIRSLNMGAYESVTNNNRVIKKTVSEQTQNLKTVLESSGLVHQVVALLVQGALTNSKEQIKPLQSDVVQKMKLLTENVNSISDPEARSISVKLNGYTQMNTGLISDRMRELTAKEKMENLVGKLSKASSQLDKLLNSLFSKKRATAVENGKKVSEQIGTAQVFLITILVIIFVMTALIGVFVVQRQLTQPITNVTKSMRKLAEGNTDIQLTDENRKDEIGDMLHALMVFKTNAIEREKMQAERERQSQEIANRQQKVEELINDFRGESYNLISSLGDCTDEMSLTAKDLREVSLKTSGMASEVAEATGETSSNIQNVASATEEMTSSISEIRNRAQETSDSVATAHTQMLSTNEKVSSLSDAAEKIGDILGLIQDIAEQTNLLALNATIEAARAGSAGKGFAVVASEVKSLANQTANATEEISKQIAEIQSSTESSVSAIRDVSNIIEKVNLYSSKISQSIEEQGNATQEISANIQNAASKTKSVDSNVGQVTEAAGDTLGSAELVSNVSEKSVIIANDLKQSVNSFLDKVAAV